MNCPSDLRTINRRTKSERRLVIERLRAEQQHQPRRPASLASHPVEIPFKVCDWDVNQESQVFGRGGVGERDDEGRGGKEEEEGRRRR